MSAAPPDDPMAGSGQESEGEGEDIAMHDASDDSSEEGDDDDAEEAQRIAQGFLVDEDEEEEEEDETPEERKARRKERRRRKKRKHSDDEEGLEDDDLELLEENTGGAFKNRRLTRLRRASGSPEASSSKRGRPAAQPDSSDDDLDGMDPVTTLMNIQNIWDDDRAGREDDEDDDMDNFIEDDEEDGALTERQRADLREQKRADRRAATLAKGKRPKEITGIDANAWDEIHDVFGDGHEYDWALAADDEGDVDESRTKPEMRYQDVFEPSEIRARMLTDDDDLIRAQDIPERMQLATSTLSQTASLSVHKPLALKDLQEATAWVCERLPIGLQRDFLQADGRYPHLSEALVKAVEFVLEHLFIHEFEVPYIWTHKQDYISWFHNHEWSSRVRLLLQNDLWSIYALGQKFRSYIERKHSLETAFNRLGLDEDEAEYYKHDIRPKIDSVDFVADATEWLSMMFKDRKEETVAEFRFQDDEEQVPEVKKRKLPSRTSAYDVTKKSIVSRLAKGFGIAPQGVVLNFLQSERTHYGDEQDIIPVVYAEQFVDSEPGKAVEPEELLRRARMLLATEIGKDPLLRQHVRKLFKSDALVSVQPTERGVAKIDEHHPYFNFKYLSRKPVREMRDSAQFLHILAAESEHLVTVSIVLEEGTKASLETGLNDAYATDSFSDTARAWNDERSRIVQEALEQHLLPAGVKHTREWIREEVEDFLADRCGQRLRERAEVKPFLTDELRIAQAETSDEVTSSILAVSWGKGDPSVDAITCIYVDEAGRYREHVKLDNLIDAELKDEFMDLLKRRKPAAIVVGGFTMATTRLSQRIREILGPDTENGMLVDRPVREMRGEVPLLYVRDDVARMFQHSKRAAEEFNALSLTAKYCIGLARYAQNPLNEYAALGSDITAISFEEDNQNLVPVDKLLFAFERVLVDIVNDAGVDVNRATTDANYQHLLPFVCGLGPRKAQVLVKKIGALGGNLVNRGQFIKGGILTTKIFLNAAGFLRIKADADLKSHKNRHAEDDVPDPLDNTRIHPEDYELARKMATDALELDEEDVQDEHPSHVITLIMDDKNRKEKLDELNLDEFAVSMSETQNDEKRITLQAIRDELYKAFADTRRDFPEMTDWEVLTMLSGETKKTLRVGLIVSVQVLRIKPAFVAVRLDSGIEGVINAEYLSDTGAHPDDVVTKGQTIQGVIIDVKLDLPNDHFVVELSGRPGDVANGDSQYRRVETDLSYWDQSAHDRDVERQARKKRAEVDRTRRVIKHPNFHNFNSSQAEAYLGSQQRGDVVIRPSSKGIDHLAVTWKVDDGVYQHIDVTEPNADPTGQTVGSKLIVDAAHTYADLDELIVTHVQAMARRVDELTMHEKFKAGSEHDLHLSLKQFVAANPAKSMYGFTLNRKKPGHFSLCFLANKNAAVQTWPVRVCPEAFYLFDAPAAGAPELCDAFKVRHLHESNTKRIGGGLGGGKTPFGQTPGYATPGGSMSVRQSARTPNAYGAAAGRTPNAYGGATSMGPPQGTPAQYGSASYTTPAHFGGGSTPAQGGPARGMPPPPQSPYVGGGYRTPAVGAGYQTPAPIHGRTPLPGGATPQQAGGFGTPAQAGWGTPAPQNLPPKPSVPSGMNPARAALMNSANARGSGSGSGW